MKVSDLLKITQGKLLAGGAESSVDPSRISTDSRTIRKGEFFIALKGPRFNGDAFIGDAFKRGVIGALVGHCRSAELNRKKIIIEVKDTTRALEDIAAWHRAKFSIPIVAITGSNGKTTAKEMLWKMVSSEYNVLKNEGTKNNNIGVSQTLLRLKTSHEACVLELGANHKGEIRRLAEISGLSVAVITNIGPSHLEFLGGLKGVFDAKSEILESFHYKGMVILNGDDRYLSRIRDSKINIARFGLGDSCDFRAVDIRVGKDNLGFSLNGKDKFKLRLLGTHNIYNALAAIAVASQFGISVEKMRDALLDYKPAHMRMNLKKTPGGVTIIDDSYNSNPLSMKMALGTLANYPANARWVVCGDMLELGRQSRRFHEMMGEMISKAGVNGLFTFGNFSKAATSRAKACGMRNVWHYSTHDQIVRMLKRLVSRGDAVLVKGSRAMKMEEVVKKLGV